MMRMQLDTTLRYSIMNELTAKERIYLGARERHNITLKDDGDDAPSQIVLSSFRPFVLGIVSLLDPWS